MLKIIFFVFAFSSLNPDGFGPVLKQQEWKFLKKTDGISLWTSDNKDSRVKQFKIQTSIKNDMNNLYSFMKDVENMNLWYDRVKSVKLLKEISKNEGVYLLEYSLPLPFQNRISTILGKIHYDIKSERITVETKYFPFKIPEDKVNLYKITDISSQWEIMKMPDGTIDVVHSGHMDPGGNIPLWLINEGVETGPLKTMKAFKIMLEKYNK